MSKDHKDFIRYVKEFIGRHPNKAATIAEENPSKMLPFLNEQLRQVGHKLLLEDFSLDIEEFREELTTVAGVLGFPMILKHQLGTRSLQDPCYDELRWVWRHCRHDDPLIDLHEAQIDKRVQELVKIHYADSIADELWSRLRRPRPFTDLGCAERFVEEHKRDLRFCKEMDLFYLWGGQCWAPDNKKCLEAKIRLKQTVRRIKQEADETRLAELDKWWKGAETAGKLGSILQAAALDAGIQIAPHEFDNRKWLLNCANTTVSLDQPVFKAYPHRRQDYLTKIVPWDYASRALCPRWMQFLQEVTGGDQDLENFLQLAIGYGITGQVSEKCLFFLHGPGDTGKTTFIETISSMLGPAYARTAGFTSFIRGVKSGIRNDLARLQGVRFVAAAEAAQEDKFDVVLLKRLTGDDTITVRHLYREYQEFRPEFKIFLAANHEPKLPADDEAAWRRFVVIPFDVPIERKEHDLKDRLVREMPGILAWAVRGAWRYYADHFSQRRPLERPRRVQEAINRYRARCEAEESTAEKTNDKAKRLLTRFLGECCERTPGETQTPEELLKAARAWCEEHFEDGAVITPNMLGRVLAQSGGFEADVVTRNRTNMRLWKNIKIKA